MQGKKNPKIIVQIRKNDIEKIGGSENDDENIIKHIKKIEKYILDNTTYNNQTLYINIVL